MSDARLDQFKRDISEMRIKDPSVARDTLLLRVGAVLLVAGVVVSIAAYFLSHGTSSTLNQNDDQTIGMAGVAVTVLGATLFLRYSLGSFLRFWLARLIYEQRTTGEAGRSRTE